MVRKRNIDEDLSDEGEEEVLREPRNKKTKPTAGRQLDDEGNRYWELSTSRAPRRATVSEFKGASLISIREFYEKDGKYLPGKKGISLTTEQYLALLKAIPEINAELRSKGVEVGSLEEATASAGAAAAPKSRSKAEKSNIDATSDEDEG